jgi:class 3 adenylate cyclase
MDAFLGDRLGFRVGPGGSVLQTILFTNLQNHAALLNSLGDEASREILREHERISREALRTFGGREIKSLGDGFMAAFLSAQRAIECAVHMEREFDRWSTSHPHRLEVRIGANAGEPIAENEDLFGESVIAASRIANRASGGQILVSNVVRELVAGKGFKFVDQGEEVLRGFEDPVRLYEVKWRD